MKIKIICIVILGMAFVACNNTTSTSDKATVDRTDSLTPQSASQETLFPADELTKDYLQIKNALANDDSKAAAEAGNAMVITMDKVEGKHLTTKQLKNYTELKTDMRENAEHISENANKIGHQREHFQMLSEDLIELVNMFGNGGNPLYKVFCPMADDGRGAVWLSEVKDIQNPYFGSEMLTCGTIKETLK